MSDINTAMILAAGLGTRLKPFTLHHPKALAPVAGKTVLQRNIEYLLQAGISRIVVNVHHFAEQVISAIESNYGWGADVKISQETSSALETGGGLQHAIPLLGDARNIVLMNADILTDLPLKEMIGQHSQHAHAATLAVTNRSSSRCFLFEETTHQLCGWKNKSTGESRKPLPCASNYEAAFSGIHVINESIFRNMPYVGAFSMVDVYLTMCTTHRIAAFDHSGSRFIDIGTVEKMQQAGQVFG